MPPNLSLIPGPDSLLGGREIRRRPPPPARCLILDSPGEPGSDFRSLGAKADAFGFSGQARIESQPRVFLWSPSIEPQYQPGCIHFVQIHEGVGQALRRYGVKANGLGREA